MELKLVKARTCRGCVELEQWERGYTCGREGYSCNLDGVPEKPCPKPRTWKQFRAWKEKDPAWKEKAEIEKSSDEVS